MIYERKCKAVIRELILAAVEMGADTIKIADGSEGDLLVDWVKPDTKQSIGDAMPALIENVFDVEFSHILFGKGKDYLGTVFVALEYDTKPDEIITDYIDTDFCKAIVQQAEYFTYAI